MSTSVHRRKSEGRSEIRIYSATRRACDGCRSRKIRCDSLQPCSNCRRYSLSCLYLHVPKKSGPRRKPPKAAGSVAASHQEEASPRDTCQSPPSKGYSWSLLDTSPRDLCPPASIMEETFESSENISTTGSMSDIPTPSLDSFSGVPDSLDFNNPDPLIPCTSNNSIVYNVFSDPLEANFPPIILLPFLEMFFNYLFPIMPVLDRDLYLSTICHQESVSPDEYCLLTAVSAVTIVQLNLPVTFVEQDIPGLSAEHLVKQCLQERNHYDYIDEPTTSTALTSFFLFGYYGNLEKHNKALHHLHEAISFAEVIGLDDETHFSNLSVVEGQWRRRVFWLLFVTERYILYSILSAIYPNDD